ncbi:hypothetical protein FA743_09675 [Paracoccus gahaiensis]|uniref:Uncharacterized protein n=2 Tax=Paracoccus TaxID=265 RepID=A0A4Z1CGA9_9RHOB|nr:MULTISPECIES: hypothetical protein [Paracoccus]TGN57839.1 hypothetical protein E4L95_12980 [Paracoccus liaowanqingii]TJZ91741.1 hypothetical protein FA743_09675 [Paracoccus gahaiensis]
MTTEYPYTTAVLSPFRRRMSRIASALTLHRQSIQQLKVAQTRLEDRLTVLDEQNRNLRKHITRADREIRDLRIALGILSSLGSSNS